MPILGPTKLNPGFAHRRYATRVWNKIESVSVQTWAKVSASCHVQNKSWLYTAAAMVTTRRDSSLALTGASVLLHPHGYTQLPTFDAPGGRLCFCWLWSTQSGGICHATLRLIPSQMQCWLTPHTFANPLVSTRLQKKIQHHQKVIKYLIQMPKRNCEHIRLKMLSKNIDAFRTNKMTFYSSLLFLG